MPRESLDEILPAGQSPYFGMFRAGRLGYTIEEVTSHCTMLGIPLRAKDIQSWQDGAFKNQVSQAIFEQRLAEKRKQPGSRINPTSRMTDAPVNLPSLRLANKPSFDEAKLTDFPKLPDGWKGCERRFFPCTPDNRPMMQWGWRPGFEPNLMLRYDAEALSPVHWVGQNMLYQNFIVMDIDGVGHGTVDKQVIMFGNQFRDMTLTLEDPKKKGSFHLYFMTDRLIPVKHFGHAKLDLMGNAVNAAVYFKNKISNGIEPAKLTSQIWDAMQRYQVSRKRR
jgi:hypothetical protein